MGEGVLGVPNPPPSPGSKMRPPFRAIQALSGTTVGEPEDRREEARTHHKTKAIRLRDPTSLIIHTEKRTGRATPEIFLSLRLLLSLQLQPTTHPSLIQKKERSSIIIERTLGG